MERRSQDELMGRLLATFSDEAGERVQALNRELLMLEGTTDADAVGQRVEALFREAHSLKGAARAVNAERVEVLSHRLESLFELMRRGEVEPDPTVCDVIYRVLDGLAQLVAEATNGEPAVVDMERLSELLDDPRRGAGDRSVADASPPARAAPAPPAEPPEPSPAALTPAASSSPPSAAVSPAGMTVRVATAKLDAVLADVGELTIAQAASLQHISGLRALAEELQAWEVASRRRRAANRRRGLHHDALESERKNVDDWEQLRSTRSKVVELHRLLADASRRVAQATAELEDEVRRSRMLPVSSILDSFPRMVRDIARAHDRQVVLMVTGAETEVDRALLDQMRSPLTHVIRNSVDHGIEPPDARRAAGKPPQGTISVGVSQQGGTLSIEVADDGAGIDIAKVKAKAVERGVCSAETAERMTEREAIGLIYRSGFSTAPIITDLSGRGVGLDVVREHIERLHGMIEVDARPGAGTRFTFVVPMSVSTTPCLLVGVAGQSFALPVTNVAQIVRVASDDTEYVQGAAVVRVEGTIVALADLAEVLGVERAQPRQAGDPSPAILIGSADQRMAFIVDTLIDLRDVVTKDLPPPLYRVRHLSGATILGTGEVVSILNAANLIRTASPQPEATLSEAAVEQRPAVVLLAEDSITTRALEQNILESAGYEVRVANDGLQAWSLLQQGGIDALVTDVYMPGIDGFELTARIRADERFARLPVVLVTSKDSRGHHDQGIAVGADAYIVKGTFEQQNLVDAVARLI